MARRRCGRARHKVIRVVLCVLWSAYYRESVGRRAPGSGGSRGSQLTCPCYPFTADPRLHHHLGLLFVGLQVCFSPPQGILIVQNVILQNSLRTIFTDGHRRYPGRGPWWSLAPVWLCASFRLIINNLVPVSPGFKKFRAQTSQQWQQWRISP